MLELQIGCLPAEIENLPATCAVDQSLVVPYVSSPHICAFLFQLLQVTYVA